MNEQNLIPMNKRTESEQREIAKKGGKASGRSRRDKREQRDVILDIMSMPLEEGYMDKIQALAQAKGSNISVNAAIVIEQVKKALEGDTKAAEYLRDTAGWKPSDKVQLDTGVNIDDTINRIDNYLKGRAKHEEGIS